MRRTAGKVPEWIEPESAACEVSQAESIKTISSVDYGADAPEGNPKAAEISAPSAKEKARLSACILASM